MAITNYSELVTALSSDWMHRNDLSLTTAAEALGITAHRLKALGLVDKIVSEPVGGAHRDPQAMAASLKRALADAWRQLADLKTDELIERRHARLNSYGRFTDTKADAKGRRG
mgnify:CR=1 FL=1